MIVFIHRRVLQHIPTGVQVYVIGGMNLVTNKFREREFPKVLPAFRTNVVACSLGLVMHAKVFAFCTTKDAVVLYVLQSTISYGLSFAFKGEL